MPFQTYFVYILTFFIFPLYIKSAKMSSFVFYKERERKKTPYRFGTTSLQKVKHVISAQLTNNTERNCIICLTITQGSNKTRLGQEINWDILLGVTSSAEMTLIHLSRCAIGKTLKNEKNSLCRHLTSRDLHHHCALGIYKRSLR